MLEVIFCVFLNRKRYERWVFNKASGGTVNIHSLETKFRKQFGKVGIPNSGLHTWRHKFASYLMI